MIKDLRVQWYVFLSALGNRTTRRAQALQNISEKSVVNRSGFSYGSPQMHRFWCLRPTVLVAKSINEINISQEELSNDV
jgi:hypothetical protein